jgi:hypothetical protein
MRRLFDDRPLARRIGAAAADDIRATHSPAAAGRIVADRLEAIRATGRTRPPARTGTPSPALAALPRRIRQGPAGPRAGRPAGRDLIRKAALRAMRPFTVYQQEMNRQLADAVREVSESIGEARRAAGRELATVLAELRASGDVGALRALIAEQARRIAELEHRLQDVPRRDEDPPAAR